MLVRFATRKTAWEECTTEELVLVEFQDSKTGEIDLRPSVYAPDGACMDQLAAEHGVTARMSPQTFLYGDLGTPGSASILRCNTCPDYFTYACSVHHELEFATAADLRAYVHASRGGWVHPLRVVRSAVLEYVRGRVLQQDAEWAAVLALPECASWASKVQ